MSYGEERVDLVGRIREQLPGRALADALRLDGRTLRFHLGTSLADMRVPVRVDDALVAALSSAVRDLFFLLSMRHRAALRPDEYDRLILLDGFDPKTARAVSFGAPPTVKGENVRRAFLEAPELHPALDSGLVASWLTSGRPGRVLAGALTVALRRAAREASSVEPPEPTSYLVLLALRACAHRALDSLRDLPVSGIMGRSLLGAVAAGLLVAVRLAAREAGVFDGPYGPMCEAACLPMPWLGGARLLWASGIAAYGVAFGESPANADHQAQAIAQGALPDIVADEAGTALAASKDAMRKAARQVALAKIRADVLSMLRLAESGKAPTLSVEGMTAAQLFQTPGALERVLATGPARKDLEKRARAGAKASSNDLARGLFDAISEAAKKWDEDDPGDWLERGFVPHAWGSAIAALASDLAIDRALGQAEAQLAHRTGAESEGGLEEEHAKGKLYFIGIEEKPLLMGRDRAAQMAHLFCDMKDFTKRTAFLKETVVADFLSREFYGPILTAAARHAHGAAHLADKGGIYLNNLLGDAVSFSGDIRSLVELAGEIRSALGSYARRLASEGSREQVAHAIEGIEERFRAQRDEVAAAVKSAQDAKKRGTLDPLSGEDPTMRLLALSAQFKAMQDEREAEIALVKGEKLEAGIFISYGAAPEVATFEDHVFGHIKVSIAEKINESARGTARNGSVRARLDRLLAQARARTRRKDLICPFAVSISQPLTISVHGETEAALRDSLSRGDVDGAEQALATPVREFVGRLASQAHLEDRGDIYNGGAAISDEALQAYMEARRSELVFVRREVAVAQLHPVIRERFVFPSPVARLVVAAPPGTETLQELYAFAGRALFKGFEKQGGLGVFEIIGRENPLFVLLGQHHVGEWLREHEAGVIPSGEAHPLGTLETETLS